MEKKNKVIFNLFGALAVFYSSFKLISAILKMISMLSCHMIAIHLPRVFNIDILNSTFNTSV